MNPIKKEEIREISPERIDLILKNYHEAELVPSAKAWERWSNQFFNKIIPNSTCMKYIKVLRERLKKDNTTIDEKEFKELFPDLKYTQYIDPMTYKDYYISFNEINRLAMLLQEEIPLTWEETKLAIEYTFRGNDWSYQGLYTVMGAVSNRAKTLLFTKNFINKNIA